MFKDWIKSWWPWSVIRKLEADVEQGKITRIKQKDNFDLEIEVLSEKKGLLESAFRTSEQLLGESRDKNEELRVMIVQASKVVLKLQEAKKRQNDEDFVEKLKSQVQKETS